MIIYKKGDLFTTHANIIVHGCNCQGVMGSGVAKQVRELFPSAYEAYREVKETTGLVLGDMIQAFYCGKFICNCLTQEYYGKDGKLYTDYEAVRSSLRLVKSLAIEWDRKKISMPRLGCGLGGGDWNIVSKIIEEELADFEVEVWEL